MEGESTLLPPTDGQRATNGESGSAPAPGAETRDIGAALPYLVVLLLALLSPLVYDLLRRLWAIAH